MPDATNRTIRYRLLYIQQLLDVPKTRTNDYNARNKYKYRSLEDIIKALKPLLKEQGCVLRMSDEVISLNGHNYVKATVSLEDIDKGESITACAYAREAESRKGMDDSQLTGAASSYARKYALNGLLAIDDTCDADALPPVETPSKDDNPDSIGAAVKQFMKDTKPTEPTESPKMSTDEWLEQQYFKLTRSLHLRDGYKWNMQRFKRLVKDAVNKSEKKTRGDALRAIEDIRQMPEMIMERINA